MHELSIALSIVDLAAEEAGRQHGGRVVAVHLRLGLLSGVATEALRSAFALAREGTALADAELVIEEIPVVVHCPRCAAERTVASPSQLSCPGCATTTPEVVRGRELELVALEIEP
jgi:hydrogenase nickel incorporation protein HypA/HybF